MNRVNTYYANIYVGLNIGYSNESYPVELAKEIIQNWVDEKGACVTVTETEYMYTGGREKGIIVGFINYPRFPREDSQTRERAIELAEILKEQLEQKRVSVLFPDETIMIGEKDNAST